MKIDLLDSNLEVLLENYSCKKLLKLIIENIKNNLIEIFI